MRTFFQTLLTEITSGKLTRLPYLTYFIILTVLPLLFAVMTVFAISAGESLLGGNLQQAQDQLRSWFSTPFIFVGAIFILAILYMALNIMVKRIRDIGLPVLLTTVIIILFSFGVSYALSESPIIVGGIDLIIFLALVLIPSNSFGNNKYL